eukprot:6179438-Pleurochrysis_carterae.AAC.4
MCPPFLSICAEGTGTKQRTPPQTCNCGGPSVSSSLPGAGTSGLLTPRPTAQNVPFALPVLISKTVELSSTLLLVVATRDLAKVLNKVSNYRQQPWYMHYAVFIVPQQIWEFGDPLRFSTAAIESRGARLKRIGRRVVYWRPYAASGSILNLIHRKTDEAKEGIQQYGSLRLREQLRSKKLNVTSLMQGMLLTQRLT